MLNKLVKTLLATVILVTSVSPSYAATDAVYVFRHKFPDEERTIQPGEQDKDITAFFVGGVGFAFDKRLPLRSDWENDSWTVVKGNLPSGISFNPATRTFSGTPTAPAADVAVELAGVDAHGRSVATARVTFDIYGIVGQPYFPDVYAHTGKYKFDQLPVPANATIQSWNVNSRLPSGVDLIGRNIDGTPSSPGVSSFFLQGKDYLGQIVATYIGTYTVEDGPTFEKVDDDIRVLDVSGVENFTLNPPPIRRAVNGDLSKVRYSLETAEGKSLPGTLTSNNQPKSLQIQGVVTRPYDQTKVRWKATDTDGTEGYSNWFDVGTGDPSLTCSQPGAPIQWLTGTDIDTYLVPPNGVSGTLTYSLASGTLPEGIRLDTDGHFRGKVTVAVGASPITVSIASIIDGRTETVPCSYSVRVDNAYFALKTLPVGQGGHVRVGETFTAKVAVEGGIPDYGVDFSGTYPFARFTSPVTNQSEVSIEGTAETAGLPLNIALSATNGDNATTVGAVPVYAYAPLAFGTSSAITIKRLAGEANWGDVAYDPSTVIPDVSGATVQPSMALANASDLPAGISFGSENAPYGFSGSTAASPGIYGPFTVALKDFSGDSVRSAPFNVTVLDRDPITGGAVTAPVFIVEEDKEYRVKAFDVVQPVGARDFAVAYSLSGPSLPNGLSFDSGQGEIVAAIDLQRSEIGTYGPYTITAVDTELSSVTSAPFNIKISDWPDPSNLAAPPLRASVSGTGNGEDTTSVNSGSLLAYIGPTTVFGGIQGVTFTGTSPASPAGLSFSSGILSGTPVSEFNGNVVVSYHDARNREGSVTVPLDIRSYPKIEMGESSFTIARMSEAATYGVAPTKSGGFWPGRAVTWSIASGQLPDGFDIDTASGAVVGRTLASKDSEYSNIVIKAVTSDPSGNRLTAFTPPFKIVIGEREPMTLDYAIAGADQVTYLLSYDPDRVPAYLPVSGPQPGYTVQTGGSFEPDLTYSIVSMPEGLEGIGINSADGRLTGSPTSLGVWTVPVRVKDAENVEKQSSITVKSTLEGFITLDNAPATVRTVRVGEPFSYPANGQPIVARNAVGSVIYSTSPAALPDGISGNFSAVTGAFSDESHFEIPGNRRQDIYVGATDADGRSLKEAVLLRFDVVDRLALTLAQNSFSATQFGEPLDISFPRAINTIGNVSYGISGIAPGTLVTMRLDDAGNVTGYDWTDSASERHVLSVDRVGVPTRHERDGMPVDLVVRNPGNGQPSQITVADNLPDDAMIFDHVALTLTGIPSKSGTFAMKLSASDDHKLAYIKNVSTRMPYNEAEANFTVTVEAAPALTAVNSASSEVLYQYTSEPTITTTVSNTAYGKPVSWRRVAGTLPSGVSASGGNVLSFSGYPEATGTYADIRYIATDAAGREVEMSALTFDVQARQAFGLVATANPAGLIVNEAAQPIRITAKHAALAQPISEQGWSIADVSNLPDGMSVVYSSGAMEVSGTPTRMGDFGPVRLTATDARGGSASIDLAFRVIAPGDAITLDVPATVKAKVGTPISIAPVAGNTYGDVKFTSVEIAGDFKNDLSIGTDGTITGSFATTGLRVVNLAVRDQTTRLTSKAIRIEVIPPMEVTIATQTSVRQGEQLSRLPDAINVIGSLVFSKGEGDWPESIVVDPATGHVSNESQIDGVTAPVGTYGGLTIKATDTFEGGNEAAFSNRFSIAVNQIEANPVIADFAGRQVHTVGTEMSLMPTVTDSVRGKLWRFGGTVYTLNKPLPAGLQFDSQTGEIHGTATAYGIVKDLVITVTAESGSTDSTAPFWFGVQPKDPIMASSGQKILYVQRAGDAYSTTAPIFERAVGTLKYALKVGNSGGNVLDENTGVMSHPGLTDAHYTGTASAWNYQVEVTDEFDRKGTFDFQTRVLYDMSHETQSVTMKPNTPYSDAFAPTVRNGYGNLSYEYLGLPTGIDYNASTGALSGTLPASAPDSTPVTMKVTDSYDLKTTALQRVIIKSSGYLYYRLNDSETAPGRLNGVYWGMMKLFNAADVDVAIQGSAAVDSYIGSPNVHDSPSGSYPALVFDSQTRTGMIFGVDSKGVKWVGTKFKTPQDIKKVFVSLADGTVGDNNWVMTYYPSVPKNFKIEGSHDGLTWDTLYKGSFSGPDGFGRTQWNATITLQ